MFVYIDLNLAWLWIKMIITTDKSANYEIRVSFFKKTIFIDSLGVSYHTFQS